MIRGTRVPLWTLVEYLDDGPGLAAFLADHPQVTGAQVNQTLVLGLNALIDRREELLRPPGVDSAESPPSSPRDQDSDPG